MKKFFKSVYNVMAVAAAMITYSMMLMVAGLAFILTMVTLAEMF